MDFFQEYSGCFQRMAQVGIAGATIINEQQPHAVFVEFPVQRRDAWQAK